MPGNLGGEWNSGSEINKDKNERKCEWKKRRGLRGKKGGSSKEEKGLLERWEEDNQA